MKPNLLKDTLDEGDYSSFRDALQARVGREARRLRMRRQAVWLAMAAAIALTAGSIFSLRQLETRPAAAIPSARETVSILVTKPIDPSLILENRVIPGLAFSTDHSRPIATISDAELFALFPGKPVGLIQTPSGARRFIFVDPNDVREFVSSH